MNLRELVPGQAPAALILPGIAMTVLALALMLKDEDRSHPA